jgi:hypothetical protein
MDCGEEPVSRRPWTPKELDILRRFFATKTNAELASQLNRTAGSVAHAAAALGLAKSEAHRAKQARKSALAAGRTPEEMAALGSLGGKIGGKARAEALSPARRRKIAKAAIAARWKRTEHDPETHS